MAGSREHIFSRDSFPTPHDAAKALVDAASEPAFLTQGHNWAQFEPIVPGATQAGMFVEVVKKASRLKAGQGNIFTLAKMIWYESVGLVRELDQDLSGDARAVLIALLGGQLYASAISRGVPHALGEFYEDTSMQEPISLSQLFSTSQMSSVQLYGGGPREYRAFKKWLDTHELFSHEDKQQALAAIDEKATRKADHYKIASRVLLEIFIERLQQQAKQQEVEHAPPLLPSSTRRDPFAK